MPKYFDSDEVEESLPEYSFQRHIDSGGFKDVFLAEKDGDEVVVKLLPVEQASRKRRARREAEAMLKIDSPHFVDLRDYFEVNVGETPAFVLEEDYIGGPTLKKRIDNGDHGIDLGFQVTETLIDLLIQFDDLNIVHRDIKPSNIMFDENDKMLLLDIGIVRFEERESITPDHAYRLGTRRYGAPEQLDYEKELQSIRTDIFSTGIVMFESFTGVHPFADRGKSTSEAIMQGDKHGLEGLLNDDELEESLGEMFDIMTQPKPHNRYRKPEFVKEDFETIMEVR